MSSNALTLVDNLISVIDNNINAKDEQKTSHTLSTYKHILCNKPLNYEDEIDRVIETGLFEDLSSIGDISTLSTIPINAISSAYLLAKSDGIISGIKIVIRVFLRVDSTIKFEWFFKDGDNIKKGDIIGNIIGKSQSILISERLSLNLMQRMSGIATQTNKMISAIKAVKSSTKLLDTRKTVPGLRIIDKLAVIDGGGCNHRMGLYDMIMIKDNHINASGGIQYAILNTNNYLNKYGLKNKIKIEIETSTLDQVKEVMKYGINNQIDRIMLDNMVKIAFDNNDNYKIDTSMLINALKIINDKFETEASGNITLDSITDIAKTNVDFVSTGSITHSVTAIDISLKFKNT